MKPASRNRRREFLVTSSLIALAGSSGDVLANRPRWSAFDGSPPLLMDRPGLQFLTQAEADALGAIVERLIPADALSPSGKEAGCVDFIDRQLAGPYGDFAGQYRQGPFREGTPSQGDQSALTPRERYRLGLAELDTWCQNHEKASFAALADARRDSLLGDLETGKITFGSVPAPLFFNQVLDNTMEGFFGDPVYGGNRNMVSWRMLGFPGARYDYSGAVALRNVPLRLEPIGMKGGSTWLVKG